MHILLLTTYFHPDSGAAAVRLTRLARLLARRGHQVTVLTALPHYPQGRLRPADRWRAWRVEGFDGLRVVRVWLWPTPSRRISRRLLSQNTMMLSAALRGLALPRPDVMLIEAQPIFTGLAGVWLSALKRVPYVLNVSDLWPDHLLSVGALQETHPVYRLARYVVDHSYRRAAAITTLSPAWARAIHRQAGREDGIHVIYNGVDLARFHPRAAAADFRAAYGLATSRYVVSFIGTFATQYDFQTMLAAADRLRQRGDVSILLVGGGSQADVVGRWLADAPGADVVAPGWIAHEAVPGAWAASDVTCFALHDRPLYAGTIPAKLYEAFAAGVPVVAALRGEGAAFIERAGAGRVTVPGDPAALADAVSGLLDDAPQRAALGAAGRAYAEAHFDPERVADRYEAVLAEVRRGR